MFNCRQARPDVWMRSLQLIVTSKSISELSVVLTSCCSLQIILNDEISQTTMENLEQLVFFTQKDKIYCLLIRSCFFERSKIALVIAAFRVYIFLCYDKISSVIRKIQKAQSIKTLGHLDCEHLVFCAFF